MTRALAALALVVLAAPAASIARASPRGCPADRQWDPNQGSCVPIKRAPRRTPEQTYQKALRHIDGSARRANPTRGVSWLEANCKARHARSCTMLGFLHRHGRHVTASAKSSVDYYQQGCERGDAEGCLGGARLVADGLLGKPDHERAATLLERACKLDSGKGCFELAEKSAKALGTKEDAERAAGLYRRARGLLEAACATNGTDCTYLGRIHAKGLGVERDDAEALAAFIRGCDGGSGDACREVGSAYREGRGAARDQLKARQFFDVGCLRYDNADSCSRVVWMMVGWDDSARDNDAVRRYAVRACDLDKSECGLVGYIHGVGMGVPANPRLASRHYLEACESGNAQSCFVAANRSLEGAGMPASKHRAIELWRKACELSWGPACHALGVAYKSGDGVGADKVEAYRHFHLACIRRSGDACLDSGKMVEAGSHGKRPNVDSAVSYYRYGCRDLDHGESCVALAGLYIGGGKVKADPARGAELYERGCDLGVAGACRTLGEYRYAGQHGAIDKLAAARLFARACRHGDPKPCWWIDRALADGDAGDADKNAALAELEGACRQGGRDQACQVLGRLYAYGGAMSARRPRDAVVLFEQRCKGGDSRGCFELGWLYAAGVGVVKDVDRASEIFRAECDKNTPNACYALGIQLWEKDDFKGAIALMTRACDEGDAAACNYQAFALYTAKGVLWNVRRAAELWKKACGLDYAQACANVAELHWHGIAVKKDRRAAHDHARRGCTPTEPAGCTHVGRGYQLGEAVKKDLERAEREYKRMCTAEPWGSAEACVYLAELYAETGGASASEIAALRQQAFDMARASARDNPYGHYVLGKLHATGVATIKSPAKALEHYAAACDGYDPLGCAAAGALLVDGAGPLKADRTRAVYFLDRACAAGLAGACESAETAREPATPKQPATPSRPRKVSSCAGCGTGGGGGAWLIALALFAWTRRRS